MDTRRIREEIIGAFAEDLIQGLQEELQRSGLLATGELYQSFDFEVIRTGLEISFNEYGIYMDQGVPAGRVRPGRDYIRGMMEWARRRGIPQDVVWAIRNEHLKRGIPLDKSKLGWIERGLNAAMEDAAGKLMKAFMVRIITPTLKKSAEALQRD